MRMRRDATKNNTVFGYVIIIIIDSFWGAGGGGVDLMYMLYVYASWEGCMWFCSPATMPILQKMERIIFCCSRKHTHCDYIDHNIIIIIISIVVSTLCETSNAHLRIVITAQTHHHYHRNEKQIRARQSVKQQQKHHAKNAIHNARRNIE